MMRQLATAVFTAAITVLYFGYSIWSDQNAQITLPHSASTYAAGTTVSGSEPIGYDARAMAAVMDAGSNPIGVLRALGRPGFRIMYVNPRSGRVLVWSHGAIARRPNLTPSQTRAAQSGSIGVEQVQLADGGVVSVLPDDGHSGRLFLDEVPASPPTLDDTIQSVVNSRADSPILSVATRKRLVIESARHLQSDLVGGAIAFVVIVLVWMLAAQVWTDMMRIFDEPGPDQKRDRVIAAICVTAVPIVVFCFMFGHPGSWTRTGSALGALIGYTMVASFRWAFKKPQGRGSAPIECLADEAL